MISAIIGGRWKNISNQNKDRLQKSFRKYIAKNYISQFRKIKNPEFRNIEEKKIIITGIVEIISTPLIT